VGLLPLGNQPAQPVHLRHRHIVTTHLACCTGRLLLATGRATRAAETTVATADAMSRGRTVIQRLMEYWIAIRQHVGHAGVGSAPPTAHCTAAQRRSLVSATISFLTTPFYRMCTISSYSL